METTKWTVAVVVLGLALGLTACSPSGSDDDESDETSVSGTWSGSWLDNASGALFAHAGSGTMAVTLDESDGEITGTISMNPDPCSVPNIASNGAVTGTFSETAVALQYDTPTFSGEQPDASLTFVTFSGEYVEATQEIRGTYDANSCAPTSKTWNGQFTVTLE